LDLRFAVGEANGPQSRVWRLWSHGGDVYCAVRDGGRLLKVSLHCARGDRPPICQLSITSEFHDKLGEESRSPTGRHLERWQRSVPDRHGDILGTRVLIPFESVRSRTATHRKPTTWLTIPDPNGAIEIALLFRPPDRHWSSAEPTHTTELAATVLPNGEQFRAVHYKYHLNDEARAMIGRMKHSAQSTPPHWSTRPIRADDTDAGLLLHGPQTDGGHRIVDLDFDVPHAPAA
jgi:hypothetical protein